MPMGWSTWLQFCRCQIWSWMNRLLDSMNFSCCNIALVE
jgi:hypothetical protein